MEQGTSKVIIMPIKEGKGGRLVVTAQPLKDDKDGNKRHFFQAWVSYSKSESALYAPNLDGYKVNRNKGYNVQTNNLESDLIEFAVAVQMAIIFE
jgi:hypothetical protein